MKLIGANHLILKLSWVIWVSLVESEGFLNVREGGIGGQNHMSSLGQPWTWRQRPYVRKCWWSVDVGRGKEAGSPWEPPERTQLRQCLDVVSVRSIWSFYLQECKATCVVLRYSFFGNLLWQQLELNATANPWLQIIILYVVHTPSCLLTSRGSPALSWLWPSNRAFCSYDSADSFVNWSSPNLYLVPFQHKTTPGILHCLSSSFLLSLASGLILQLLSVLAFAISLPSQMQDSFSLLTQSPFS